MKRTKVAWSNGVDQVEGPCVVCGKEVRFVIPDDRPDPALLYHSTCDMMPVLREQLKKAAPPRLPDEYVIPRKAAPAPKPAVAPAAAAPTSATSGATPTPPPPTPPSAS